MLKSRWTKIQTHVRSFIQTTDKKPFKCLYITLQETNQQIFCKENKMYDK